jgi:hypothetical protein
MRHQVMRREQTIQRPSPPTPSVAPTPSGHTRHPVWDIMSQAWTRCPSAQAPWAEALDPGPFPSVPRRWAPPCHRTVPGRRSAGGRAMSWGHVMRVFEWYGFC